MTHSGSDENDENYGTRRTYLHSCAMHLKLDDGEEVTIWSPPPFDRLFFPCDKTSSLIEDVFMGLMEKHCECSHILDLVRGSSSFEDIT